MSRRNRRIALYTVAACIIAGIFYLRGTAEAAMKREAQSRRLLISAEDNYHRGDIDGAIKVINEAVALDPENVTVLHDASGYHFVKGMTLYVTGKPHHYKSFETALGLSRRASKCDSDNAEFYDRAYADALLFSCIYEYPVPIETVAAAWDALKDTGDYVIDRHVSVRRAAVHKMLDESTDEGRGVQ